MVWEGQGEGRLAGKGEKEREREGVEREREWNRAGYSMGVGTVGLMIGRGMATHHTVHIKQGKAAYYRTA